MRGTAAELAARYAATPPKGEIVLVLAPLTPPASDAVDPRAVEALRELVEAGAHPRKAAGVVAGLTGGSANALYRALISE